MLRLVVRLSVVSILLHVSMSQATAQSVRKQPSVELANALAQRVDFPGISEPKLTLGAVLQDLEKRYKLPISVHELAFRDVGVRDVLDLPIGRIAVPEMKDVPLANVLRAIIPRVSPRATFICNTDEIEITTRAYALRDARDEFYEALIDCMDQLRLNNGFELDLIPLSRKMGAVFYWHHVLSENAKMCVTEALTAPKGKANFDDIPIRVRGSNQNPWRYFSPWGKGRRRTP